MKAMILAAGLGSRLRPLTDTTPKALIEVSGRPLLEYQLQKLERAGVTEVIINTHHLAEQIHRYISAQHFGLRIEISHEEDLLDTGGGLKKAAWFFDDGQPFILQNTDVLSDLDYTKMLTAHRESKGLATLAVRQRDTSRYFLFDDQMRLAGWENVQSGDKRLVRQTPAALQRLSFMGIHIISPELFGHFPAEERFSIVEFYLQLSAAGHSIGGFRGDDYDWLDVGKPQQLAMAQTDKRFDHLVNSKR